MTRDMVFISVDLLVMVVQDEDDSGDRLGFSGHLRLGLNGADLGELVDLRSRGPCLMVVPVELINSRKKGLL